MRGVSRALLVKLNESMILGVESCVSFFCENLFETAGATRPHQRPECDPATAPHCSPPQAAS